MSVKYVSVISKEFLNLVNLNKEANNCGLNILTKYDCYFKE